MKNKFSAAKDKHLLEHVILWVRYVIAISKLGYSVHVERRQLLELDEYQLRDIGLTDELARKEAYRGHTDLPSDRLVHIKKEIALQRPMERTVMPSKPSSIVTRNSFRRDGVL